MVDKKLAEILGTIDVSNVLDMNMQELTDYLISINIFSREKDVKLFILEHISLAFAGDSIDWPIRYYEEGEELAESNNEEPEVLNDKMIDSDLKNKK